MRTHAPGTPFVLEDVPWPDPGPGEVVVRVAACGVCHSDVHVLDGMPMPAPLPLTLGHEPAGTIEAVGEGVNDWAEGDRVAMHLGDGCGTCRACLSGHPMCCPKLGAVGLHFDGAYADAVKVPQSVMVRVPDEVSLAAAAVATDCVATPYHALKCRARMESGEKVVVIGVGGLGSMAIELARVLGAGQIVAVDTNPLALERAERLGATDVVLADRDPVAGIRAATTDGADIVLECVGSPDTVAQGVNSLVGGGRCVAVGVGIMPPRIDSPQALFALFEYSLLGTFASHKEDLEEVLRMEAEGAIDIEASISERYPLERAIEALDILHKGGGDVQRMVIEPGLDA
ncbi:MAG: zinc-binding dehydrogenase [Acidimicrobiia bacterium]|nr:zinc-binding dehydrogenase [Acidimicrobiia bacterium]